MTQGIQALTEKEKQTLRLMVRGYDAKSMANHLGLSVHTVNERLRAARRKLEVSSSREAARLLAERETLMPKNPADEPLGDAGRASVVGEAATLADGPRPETGSGRITKGIAAMSLLLATLALAAVITNETPADAGSVMQQQVEADVLTSAQNWLALVDAGDWAQSWRETGAAFRDLNTQEQWASLSDVVRTPMGAVESREMTEQEFLPAPPAGYQVVKFRTTFAGTGETVETVTLEREADGWRVVGYIIG